jgi:hypothetical protein
MSHSDKEKPFLSTGTVTRSEVENLLKKKEVFEKELNDQILAFEKEHECRYLVGVEDFRINGVVRIDS